MTASVAIVGYTGFLGSALARDSGTRWLFNSANIADIRGRRFDVVINAAGSSLKWKANKEPEEDRRKLLALWEDLQTVEAQRFVHISTIDIMPRVPWDEETPATESGALQPYGRHRREFEEWVCARFSRKVLVVRMPHLFGTGLKKNFVFDLLHNPGSLHLTDARDLFCFYDTANAWTDIMAFCARGLAVVNVAVEPMSAADVAAHGFGLAFDNRTERGPALYDMRTKVDYRGGATTGYMYTREETIQALRRFAKVSAC
jgi:nucleoside-diphosphate-sugar epimerase